MRSAHLRVSGRALFIAGISRGTASSGLCSS
jgi:hypothetical protein